MKDPMNVLLINAHLNYPGWSEGHLNKTAQETAHRFFEERGDEVTETIIDAGYDPAEEERKHREAGLVILQTPINWFSAPWTWKKYADEVFNLALAEQHMLTGDGRTREDPSIPYGSGGLMRGRRFMICSTWNAPANAFEAPGNPVFRGQSLDETLSSITAIYRFCGYDILPGFAFLDVFKNPQIEADLTRYAEHLATHAA